ncbi:MAG: STAS domain-containing protein [Phormidesmis sp.]
MTPNVQVLKHNGVLDGSSANSWCDEIVNAAQNGPAVFLLDFQEVTFMNSSGIGALVSALKKANKADSQLFICSMSTQVEVIFRITKLDKLFKVFESREAFDQAFSVQSL